MLLSFNHAAVARDWWASPAGINARDGSTRENAAGQSTLQSILDQLKPGDRLTLLEGVYRDLKLTLKSSGTAQQPITIVGEGASKLPVFESDWSVNSPKRGPTAFSIKPGVSHIQVRDITIRGYQHGFVAHPQESTPPRVGFAFQNVDMENIRHGFYLSQCRDLSFSDCDLKRYSKHGFRFEAGCENVVLKQCTADCTGGDSEWEKQTEEFPFGFFVNDGGAPNARFLFENCSSMNNLMPLQTTKYKNGDGFVVEGNSKDVRFQRCLAVNNQDGGFDLKVSDVHLNNCVALRNKRDFRIWTTGRLTNCYAGWSQVCIWTSGGPIVAERCTLAGWKSAPVLAEDTKIGVELHKCLLVVDGTSVTAADLHAVTLIDCIQSADLESAGLNSQVNWSAASATESGTTDLAGFDSSKHRDVGFRAKR